MTSRPTVVLGIETSCDETGVSLIRARPDSQAVAGVHGEILSQALHSQVALHAAYGGVVPELASRDHILRLTPLTQTVLAEAGLTWSDVSAIGYTAGPGLAGALLVGAATAHGLGFATGRPVMPIHHLEGHLLSPLLDPNAAGLRFPFLALLVSGGHTQIMRVDGLGHYTLLGETIDDAAGEAFDKSAQLLGLGYPGGPAISLWATRGEASRFKLPRPLLKRADLDFSFAGLKTAVLTHVQALQRDHALDDQAKADLAAGVQAAIVEVLVAKCKKAIQDEHASALVVAGGVGANRLLRHELGQMAKPLGVQVCFPAPELCTDNGVMIAWAAALRLARGDAAQAAGAFTVLPRWPLSELTK
ncbi:MAG: O-sialoglycoprotein endopeptidase [Pseudomonadota bacterium]